METGVFVDIVRRIVRLEAESGFMERDEYEAELAAINAAINAEEAVL